MLTSPASESLHNNKNNTPLIGVLVQDTFNLYDEELVKSLLNSAEQYGVRIAVLPISGPSGESGTTFNPIVLEKLISTTAVESLIISAGTVTSIIPKHDLETLINRLNIPVITISTQHGDQTPVISFDNYAGGQKQAEHAIQICNRTKIAFIHGPLEHPEHSNRFCSVVDTLEKHQIPLDPDLVYTSNLSGMSGAEAVKQFIEGGKPFDCIICPNDETAIWAMHGLKIHGLHIPNDVAVIGMDDVPRASTITPQLTTIRQPIAKFGQLALDLIQKMRHGDEIPLINQVQPDLIIRGSCGAPPELATKIETDDMSIEDNVNSSALTFMHSSHYKTANVRDEPDLLKHVDKMLAKRGFEPKIVYGSLTYNPDFTPKGVILYDDPKTELGLSDLLPYCRGQTKQHWFIFTVFFADDVDDDENDLGEYHEGKIICIELDKNHSEIYEGLRILFYAALQKLRMLDTIRAYNTNLEGLVEERTVELESALAEKEQLFSILSHNLRNPIAAVKITVDLLDPGKFETTPEMREKSRKRAQHSIGQILAILDELLEGRHSAS